MTDWSILALVYGGAILATLLVAWATLWLRKRYICKRLWRLIETGRI